MSFNLKQSNISEIGTTIWTFWDGNPPELILRCIETIRLQNPHREVIVLDNATLPLFLDPEDYPFFHGRRGNPEDFSCAQYLSDWVRLTLLEKYGGVWFDASVICTNSVDSWIDSSDPTRITMFPMHANPNIHGNWAMATMKPGHPLIRAWRAELSSIFDEAGPGQIPTAYIHRVFLEYPMLLELWNEPNPPPLPYLWVYLALQVVLQKYSRLHCTIRLLPSISGPMYRRYQLNVVQGIKDAGHLSQSTAEHLANEKILLDKYDRHFIKLVGNDRGPCQALLNSKTFVNGSPLHYLSRTSPRSITYGVDLNSLVYLKETRRKSSLLRASIFVSIATQRFTLLGHATRRISNTATIV